MKLRKLENRSARGYVTFGCVWEEGEVKEDTQFSVRGEDGQEVPAQSRVTAWYPDGSVKWTAHTASAGKLGNCAEVQPVGDRGERSDNVGQNCRETEQEWILDYGRVSMQIPKSGGLLFSNLCLDGELRIPAARTVLLWETRKQQGKSSQVIERELNTKLLQVKIEEQGRLFACVKWEGIHTDGNLERIPFILRMRVGVDSGRLDFTETFFYDGDEKQEFLKGIGIRLENRMCGEVYNRHVKFALEHGMFRESAALLSAWHPRLPQGLYEAQCAELPIFPEGVVKDEVAQVMANIPLWDSYELHQDNPWHFIAEKKTAAADVCRIPCIEGSRAPGWGAVSSGEGCMLFAIRKFREKAPAGFSVTGIAGELGEVTLWFYSPKAGAMDYRHYADRGYNQAYYEGYDKFGADPYGIGVTCEASVELSGDFMPSDQELEAFGNSVSYPAVYVGMPEYYHRLHAFGRWSLPARDTQMERWLEEQLDRAFSFYQQEVEQRGWYGLYNYGDVMHTYDAARHCWKYDMGGYAWDNTELVPTLWLWLYFLRTGREDVFSMAEALTRHTSEVDVYHFGPLKGMGSRHNVRHWGCPCKEARIAMTGHHRVYYYLTGDYRLGDIFDEMKDVQETFLKKDPLEEFYDRADMVYPTHARSGPDWSSLCANWMTRWERHRDEEYRRKIETGIEDIARMPLRLISGPDMEFDPATSHLRYIGERTSGGTHLQICMGAPQIWLELSELLKDEKFKEMLAEYGRFYYLPREEQLKRSNGILADREFSLPFMAAAMAAYGSSYYGDRALAKTTWSILLRTLAEPGDYSGFAWQELKGCAGQERLKEIPWISTNFTAQWCLNVIMALEFIRKDLPEDFEEADRLLQEAPQSLHRKA